MGRGGSRSGAGRPGWKIKHEDCIRMDVRWMARTGRLNPGTSGTLTWTRGSEEAGNAGFRIDADALWILCTINGQPADQRIPTERTPCNYGGSRSWFLCPTCGKRMAVLYLRHSAFKCRTCARVAYRSQSEDALGRSWIRQQKAEAKLGKGWARPKGMHETTAQRLRRIVFDCEEQRENAITLFLESRRDVWI